jgi:hypothetical protein
MLKQWMDKFPPSGALALALFVLVIALLFSPPETAGSPGGISVGDQTTDKYSLEKISALAAAAFTGALAIFAFVQIRDARLSSEKQLRAYVEVESIRFDRPSPEGIWWITVTLKNFGVTPAQLTGVRAEKFLGPRRNDALPFELTNNAGDFPLSRMPPGHITTISFLCPELGAGMQAYVAKNQAGERAYLWGRVTYLDSFGHHWYLNFQLYNVFGDSLTFSWCRAGNDTGRLEA